MQYFSLGLFAGKQHAYERKRFGFRKVVMIPLRKLYKGLVISFGLSGQTVAISLPLILLGSEILSFQQGPLCFCHLVEAWQSPNQAGHLFALRLPAVYNSCGHFLDDLVGAPSVSITVRKSLCHKELKESPQTLIQYTLLSCVVP